MPTRHTLLAIWVAVSLGPFLVFTDPVVGGGASTAALGLVVVVGWIIIGAGLRRDSAATDLWQALSSTPGRLGVAIGVGLVLWAATSLSGGAGVVVATLLGLVPLAIWSGAKSAAATSSGLATALLLGVSLAVCLGLGELVFRSGPIVARTGGNNPGARVWEQTQYDRTWEKNSLGLRSRHIGDAPKPGVRRVVVVGDSFTWGYFVRSIDSVWTYVLEDELGRRGKPVDVINLGKNGLSSADEAVRLRELGWLFQPDLVVIQYTLNDPIQGPYADYFRLAPIVPWFNGVLQQRSYLFSFLLSRANEIQTNARYPEGLLRAYRDGSREWSNAKAALADMAAQAKARKVPIVMVIFPSFGTGRLDAHYRYASIHLKVAETARAAGIPVIDLGPRFYAEGRLGTEWWAVPMDGHPGPAAHRLAGLTVADSLGPMGLLPAPATGTTK